MYYWSDRWKIEGREILAAMSHSIFLSQLVSMAMVHRRATED